MRFVRHLLLGLIILALVMVGLVAFVLYDPLSHSSRTLSAAQLITAPSSGAAAHSVTGELPIQDTDPAWLSTLARRYQPTVVVSGYDRFWPTSLPDILTARWRGSAACIYIKDRCARRTPTVADLSGPGAASDWLQLPTPLDNVRDTFAAVARQLGVPATVINAWPHDLSRIDPFSTAQVYFYYLPRTTRRSYPGLPAGLISLEYWFLYPLNYFPLVRIPLEAISRPIASTLGNTDYHQGDLEHVAVLLDPKTHQPRYLWMARHADEGEAYRWGSDAVQYDGDHPTVYAALGSHASYAHCGIQRRSRTYRFINDYVICTPHQDFGFTAAATPLVDLTHTTWACWRGHLGEAGRHLIRGVVGFAPYETSGPVSPLLQQENFRTACHLAPGTPKPAAPL